MNTPLAILLQVAGSFLFGLIVLGEGVGMGLVPAIAMGGFGAVAVLGVVLLSKGHPEALRRQGGGAEPSPGITAA